MDKTGIFAQLSPENREYGRRHPCYSGGMRIVAAAQRPQEARVAALRTAPPE